MTEKMDTDKKNPQSPENASIPKSDPTRNTCLRCGTCCEKGGPSFHLEDRMLIEKGKIHSKSLYTLRRGEHAYDNIKGCLMPVTSDIIKIKGQEDSWTCIFFDAGEKACSIYNDRPAECRALKCWDTDALEQIYDRNRLTRKDLILQVKGLWDLIEDHQARCDYEKIKNLIKDLDGRKKDGAQRKLLEIIRYDTEVRKLVVAQGGLDSAMLDFIFGRPLTKTLQNYGIKVRQDGKKTFIHLLLHPRQTGRI